MKYAWWFMDQNPEDGVEIFVRSPRAKEMDSNVILDKLEAYGNNSVRIYLEYLVVNRKSEEPEHHTRLACSYIHDVQLEIERSPNGAMQQLVDEYKRCTNPSNVNENEMTFVSYLGTRYVTSNLVRARISLIRLLQRSPLYDPKTLLEEMAKAGVLDIEMAIVYGRMKRHEEALRILIHDLGDFVGAETYCVTNGQNTGAIPEIQENGVSQTSTSTVVKEDAVPIPLSAERIIERRCLFSMLLKTYLGIEDR
ncbi:hypothetical protein BX666DRAFT_1847484 [Dichotomocladium elegans]|nr:hypothetical protein BX666DRAFT_1847484 [Dichotomocladium elegans]